MNFRAHKSHEVIYGGRKYSRRAVIVYVCLSASLGLLLGSSPLLTGFLSGLSHQKEHIIAKHPFINNENRHSYPMAQSRISSTSNSSSWPKRTGGSGGRPRLLFQTASYTMDQFHGLQKAMDCMRDICNAGWDVTVSMQTASGFDEKHERFDELRERMFCVDKMNIFLCTSRRSRKLGLG